MTGNKKDVMRYIGAAAAVGGTMLLGSEIVKSNRSMKKKIKKTANKALDAVDEILCGMQSIVK